MTLVAGVDSSTQSCKVVVCDLVSGALVRSGRASHPHGTEVDPQAWWDAVQAAILDAGGIGDVEAISISGQQHGMVVLDASGQVIRPALLWNDTRSAAAAAKLTQEIGAGPGDVVVSIGTSGTVFAVTDTPSADLSGAVAGFADASGRYLPIVTTLNAARVLVSASTLLGVDLDTLAELALAAEPGCGGLVLVPYFEGERTPNLPGAKASLHGMTIAATNPENVARAAHEGMLSGLGAGLDAVRAVGVDDKRLLLIGGAAQSRAVQMIAAQVFDSPIQVPEPGEYVAHGAAVQAAWVLSGAGRSNWLANPSPITTRRSASTTRTMPPLSSSRCRPQPPATTSRRVQTASASSVPSTAARSRTR
jgi:sugar (pentulose or hexulose) kinase